MAAAAGNTSHDSIIARDAAHRLATHGARPCANHSTTVQHGALGQQPAAQQLRWAVASNRPAMCTTTCAQQQIWPAIERPACGRARTNHRARCRASSCHSRRTAVRQPLDHRAAWCARPATSGATIALGGGQQSASHVHNDLRTTANLAGHCASSARPLTHNRARMMRRRTRWRPTIRQSGPRTEGRLLCQPALEGLTRSARTDSPREIDRSKSDHRRQAAADGGRCGGGGGRVWEKRERRPIV
ncbi:hypothetical protein F511_25885 [Dorcoceras hygrometricum]|uniref:Uncharacterized protein n=1 Tax=Dorcoceras hygrometricum TaxID=472368 RepID=A0A2Z7A5K2_9LAMI|nr:hypothetical protein F511_25885 [Dorcoceras hygrometricum]